MKKNHEKVKIRVEHGDALTFEADVIVLKYAQELYGLDYQVVKSLEQKGIEIRSKLPEVGEYHLVNSMNQIASRSILFVGVKELYYFRYQEIREFARRSLTSLAELAPETKHICLTRRFNRRKSQCLFRSWICMGLWDSDNAYHSR